MSPRLERRPLRTDISHDLAERVISGDLAPGTRLRDTVLAQELGVSRTPVREALVQLVQRGLLEADAGRGFTVAPLSRQDIVECYPMLWTLESLALELAGPADARRCDALDALNAPFDAYVLDAPTRLAADDAWHGALLGDCGNALLLANIRDVKARVRRYEYLYARQRAPRVSFAEHSAVIASLRVGDAERARTALVSNWRGTMGALLQGLDSGIGKRGFDSPAALTPTTPASP
jgi:DNA-binding GntR family transcriptional regulator